MTRISGLAAMLCLSVSSSIAWADQPAAADTAGWKAIDLITPVVPLNLNAVSPPRRYSSAAAFSRPSITSVVPGRGAIT